MDTNIIIGVCVVVAIPFLYQVFSLFTRKKAPRTVKLDIKYDYDAIVVGGSIAGPVISKLLSDQKRRVLMIERDNFERPDRIVGELMQPGGLELLEKIGMRHLAEDVGVLCTGYVTIHEGEWVQLPYVPGVKGTSFHFGDFVQNLRKHCRENCSDYVTMKGGSVNDVLIDRDTAVGVEFTSKSGDDEGQKVKATAPLVIMCDGGGSKWKSLHQHHYPPKKPHSHFVGVILRGMTMPVETKGHVFLGKDGPILSYRLDKNEVRVLAAYTGAKLPGNGNIEQLKKWLVDTVAPQMPKEYHQAMKEAVTVENNVRSMPINQYRQTFPAIRGYIGLGDHANQRHPLTGGGMTCAMRDAVNLADNIKSVKSFGNDPDALQEGIIRYTRQRNQSVSTINILSWALYAVFSGPRSMRTACFAYFKLGGDCVNVPMALLAGLNSSGISLLYHYARVMIYGAWILIYRNSVVDFLTFFINPMRIWDAIYLLMYSIYVFAPLVKMEFLSVWRTLNPTCFEPLNKISR